MNGAQSLIHTLVNGGVELCFMNPGTSEMHFVAALDGAPAMRGVLCLFEGVATGAADSYGRMAGKPAATLLHLGPGLGNGIANLHNAHTPLVNIVGEHATWHIQRPGPGPPVRGSNFPEPARHPTAAAAPGAGLCRARRSCCLDKKGAQTPYVCRPTGQGWFCHQRISSASLLNS
ncbi:MAG: hypothetical protein HY328_00385 [Chloroflexi bacterium]|nr:hypothetical protein [Chloroflexota bacterium]